MSAIGFCLVLIGSAFLWVAGVGVTAAVGLALVSLLRRERGPFWVAMGLCLTTGIILVVGGQYAMVSSSTASTSLAG